MSFKSIDPNTWVCPKNRALHGKLTSQRAMDCQNDKWLPLVMLALVFIEDRYACPTSSTSDDLFSGHLDTVSIDIIYRK